MLMRSKCTPSKLSANHKRAQALLKRVKDSLAQRETSLKKLSKDWKIYEEKRAQILTAVQHCEQKTTRGEKIEASTEKHLESMHVSLCSLTVENR